MSTVRFVPPVDDEALTCQCELDPKVTIDPELTITPEDELENVLRMLKSNPESATHVTRLTIRVEEGLPEIAMMAEDLAPLLPNVTRLRLENSKFFDDSAGLVELVWGFQKIEELEFLHCEFGCIGEFLMFAMGFPNLRQVKFGFTRLGLDHAHPQPIFKQALATVTSLHFGGGVDLRELTSCWLLAHPALSWDKVIELAFPEATEQDLPYIELITHKAIHNLETLAIGCKFNTDISRSEFRK